MGRLLWGDQFWDGKRKEYATSVVGAGTMLIILFLANMCYIYGSHFDIGHRVNNLNVLAVDFDGGVIGRSLSAAYANLEGRTFPLLDFADEVEYPTVQDVRNAVCRGSYWAGIFVHQGASSRLSKALNGGPEAQTYESNSTITYIFNTARYAPIAWGNIGGSLETLIGASNTAYHVLNGSYAITNINVDDPAAMLAFTSAITSSSIDIMPTSQGTKVLYNTVTMFLPVLQQFFLLMTVNDIDSSYGLYGRLHLTRIGFM
ncbi:hypothetical protein B0O99DRAFT_727106 [Bisporella sp. PMI_857]|nr:hypothetical protein B0O99DRAFT_727106 [Bisporella sp. PMI_857]